MTTVISSDRPVTGVGVRIEDARLLARRSGRPTFVTRTERLPTIPDPVAFLEESSRALGDGVLWEQTATGVAFAGAGVGLPVRAQGPSRFGAVSAAIADLGHRLIRDDDVERFPIIGGFAFAFGNQHATIWTDFPDALLTVPRVLLQVEDGTACVRVTVQVDPAASVTDVDMEMQALFAHARRWCDTPRTTTADPAVVHARPLPDRGAWESTVATAVTSIREARFDKVVLAREERLFFAHDVSPTATLTRLRAFDPEGTRFAMQSGDAWFVGSSPERLVRLEDGRVDVTCLAGSIGIGRDAHERRRLASALLVSAKDREEHDIVVRSTLEALQAVCDDVVERPGSPRVVVARSVQHLETPLTGRLREAARVLDLVERLHPTPAVGGFPREPALAAMRELEAIDRGWYAGPFGWTDLDGSGEFVVAIRSALLKGRSASLFAGSGIVADSVPASEWDETCLKLRPMLAALGAA